MKVMIIVGTRPELIRLSRIIYYFRKMCDCILVHTGQNYSYELGEIFYTDLDILPPDYYLGAIGESLAETIGLIITKVDKVLEKENPDAVFVLGDTNSALSVIPAKRRKIPIFHYEAGNRCFDQRVPEEINRKIVDHTADVNLTYSEVAKQNLLLEGIQMDRVLNIGSPMFEILEYYKDKIMRSKVLDKLNVEKGKYFLLSSHREENVDDPERLRMLESALERIIAIYNIPIIFSLHPRTESKLKERNVFINPLIRKNKPLSFTDYIAAQKNAFCVLSDSGTITEESAILGFPAVNLRETHERHEGMEKASVVMAGFNADRIIEGINASINQTFQVSSQIDSVIAYKQQNTSEKVFRIVLSYIDYINRVVWNK